MSSFSGGNSGMSSGSSLGRGSVSSGGRFSMGANSNAKTITGKITDINPGFRSGTIRVMISEKGKRFNSNRSIDMPTKYGRDLKRRGTYTFAVEEREMGTDRFGSGTWRNRTPMGYYCDSKPEEFSIGKNRKAGRNKYGGNSRIKEGSKKYRD